MSIRLILASTLTILICLTGPASATEGPSAAEDPMAVFRAALEGRSYYLDIKQINLPAFLPPPPAAGSPAEVSDLTTVLRMQWAYLNHTPVIVSTEVFTFLRYANGLDWEWKVERLSSDTKTFFERFSADMNAAAQTVKVRYVRPRPFVAYPAVLRAESKMSRSFEASQGGYPSGHAAKTYGVAFLLAAMVPEKTREIFVRADTVAWEKVVEGSHFPTDTNAARTAASVLLYAAFQNPVFKSDFDKARSEVRAALKLP